jgi:hypothetical protein
MLDNLTLQLADPLLYAGSMDESEHPMLDRPYEKHAMIDFGAVGEKEVWQNVKYALLTTYYDVPLDREFGIDATFVDKPIPIAMVVLSQEVALKIGLYEPRAQFLNVSFKGEGLDGKLEPTVVVSIDLTQYLAPPKIMPTTEKELLLPWIRGPRGTSGAGIPGPIGPPGPEGPPGDAATIDVGTTITGLEGTDAIVENVGTTSAAIFNFVIPRGIRGSKWFNGEIDPVELSPEARSGDYYLNSITGDIFLL